MTPECLLLISIFFLILSGLAGFLFPQGSTQGQRFACLLHFVAAVFGITAAFNVLLFGAGAALHFPLSIPQAEFAFQLDELSAMFVLPVLVISALGSLYGVEYWSFREKPESGRELSLFYALLNVSMIVLLCARNGMLFLIAWEVMALSSFFLIITEHEKKEAQEAGWLYFICAHLSTLILFTFFAVYASIHGSMTLEQGVLNALPAAQAHLLFFLALLGFGIKAGFFPLHFWLPSAHAAAPSHVSALLSGVLIKMGIYGIMRVCWLFAALPASWGIVLLSIGVTSALIGVLFALSQHDIKRLLAYHSIENIGIILIGFGLAVLGRALNQPTWVLLGMAGALLHVWNHGLFKALLFLGAGSVVHQTGTREMDRLGGISKNMPKSSFAFLVGALAISGLPPLNGFVSELLIYLCLFRAFLTGHGFSGFVIALATPALALVGALALACFVKVFGLVFLGEPRSAEAAQVKENGRCMVYSMRVLVGACFTIGLLPIVLLPLLNRTIAHWARTDGRLNASLEQVTSLGWLSVFGFLLLAMSWFLSIVLRRNRTLGPVPTWDCGFLSPVPSMQYTSSSFAQMLISAFRGILLPKDTLPRITGPFPRHGTFHTHAPDLILDRVVNPFFSRLASFLLYFRVLQRGEVQAYIFYIFLTLVILLFFV